MNKISSRKNIYAITFVDISYSWGPAIHFVELWNEYISLNDKPVRGYAVLERNNGPYTDVDFGINYLNINNNKNVLKRRIAKIILDLFLFIKLLIIRQSIVYIRQSRFGIFLLISLFLKKHNVYIEMNGLAKEDQKNSYNKAGYLKIKYCEIVEWLYMKIPGVVIISVADEISKTIQKRYRAKRTYTVKNGCSTKLIDIFKSKMHSDVLNIGFLGTFTPWDGHEKTGDLYNAIKATGQQVHFHIAGPDVEKTIIYNKYKDNKDFMFYGNIQYSKLKDFYEKLDAAYGFNRIDRSKNVEQSALKLLEYWACKLPILSTAAKGNEFIEKYKIGYLVKEDEYNDKEKFSGAVKKFLESLHEYKKNYEYAPLPRTWRDVAEDTKEILNV